MKTLDERVTWTMLNMGWCPGYNIPCGMTPMEFRKVIRETRETRLLLQNHNNRGTGEGITDTGKENGVSSGTNSS